jgi:hypothetical protein
MITLALLVVFSMPPAPVQVCEINEYAPEGEVVLRQVVLYRWHPQLRKHHVAQWWLAKDEPQVQRRGDLYHVSSMGRTFTAMRVHRTTTKTDPELMDRRAFRETARTPLVESK